MRGKISYAAVIGIAFVLLIAIVGGIILFSHALGEKGSPTGSSNSPANASVVGGPNATNPNVSARYRGIEVGAELNNSIAAGFTVNLTTFREVNASQCQLEPISYCNNNEPGQFVCINSKFASGFEAQRNMTFANKPRACPLFILAGNISCAFENGYCIVTDTYPGQPGLRNSSNSS